MQSNYRYHKNYEDKVGPDSIREKTNLSKERGGKVCQRTAIWFWKGLCRLSRTSGTYVYTIRYCERERQIYEL